MPPVGDATAVRGGESQARRKTANGRTAMAEVSVRGLTKRFGAVTAVRDLTFEVPAGVTGFLGPNGAGKTTTLRMLLGLVAPTAGTATIGGRNYRDLRHPRRVVGALLETSGFHPGRSARQHLTILAGLAGLTGPAVERVEAVLDEVGLTADAGRRVGGYSLGMRQRLGLAGALLGDPEVLILDEPGNGLDPAGMSWLRGLLRDLARQGRTVIVSSHVLAEIAQTADRAVIVNAGTLRYAGPLDELSGSAGSFEALEAAFLRLTDEKASLQEGRVQ
jgi:ABC-2 type transport system ATP-binding protein